MFDAEDAIKAGDQVRHKGGGPLMIVEMTWEDEEDNLIAGCSWFTEEGRTGAYQFVEIATAALELIQAS